MQHAQAILFYLLVGLVVAMPVAADAQEQAKPAQADTDQADIERVKQAQANLVEPAKPAAAKQEAKAGEQTEQAPKTTDTATAADAEVQEKPAEKSSTDIRREMQQLEAQLRAKRQEFQQKTNEEKQNTEEPEASSVQDIVLPDDPTREQVEAYMAKLREHAEKVRSFSSNDPIVDKIKAVPDEHFDLVVDEIVKRTRMRYFVNYALREVDKELLRHRFIESMQRSDAAIEIIVMNGWTQDIKSQVIERLETADGSLSLAWFQAAVEIGDPSLYPKLHEVTINSRMAGQFINTLNALPDYDLANTVNTCWKRASSGKLSISQSSLALQAAEFGNVDALGYLISQLRYTPSYTSSSISFFNRRLNALRFIQFRGTNEEIIEWYESNKERLVFDHFTKQFTLLEAGELGPLPAQNPDAKPQQQVDPKIDPEAQSQRKPEPKPEGIKVIAEPQIIECFVDG